MNVSYQLRNLLKFNIVSLTKRTVVSQGGVKNGTIILPYLSCGTGFNKNEYMKIGSSCLMYDKNIPLLSECISHLSIKDGISRRSITEPGPVTEINVGLPFIDLVERDFRLPSTRNRELIDPTSNIVEKKARKSLIRIRKDKMKRHKYKKLQKKMKYVFARIKNKRKARREKEFMRLISNIIDDSKNYDPAKELEENIKMLQWKRPVTHVEGYLAPKSVVEDYLKEQELRTNMSKRAEECLKKMEY